jgi:hypothetical protein
MCVGRDGDLIAEGSSSVQIKDQVSRGALLLTTSR